MVEALSQVLNNPKYAKNMKVMSAIFRDRPMSPIETAVYWTEFVLRHEDLSSLKPLNNLNFFQRRFLDVLLVLILLVMVITLVLINTCMWLRRKLSRKDPSEKAHVNGQQLNAIGRYTIAQHRKKE
ncbi:unnamed protein product [Allacma fusca]|uniref:UDP-glucuronosyltransferase n=1 Tax=Allacma fusca TaxID=39272 RepID=A0A8J2LJS1_9HEXA|nr:unnamed protein product [Allacma fusca]